MRELKEEFGLKASRLSYLCTVECDVFRHGEPVHAVSKIFVCQYNNINIVGAEHPSDGEMQLLQWFPLDTNFDDWKDSMFPPTYKALEHYKRETMEG
jgi:ADP-ribose pyrophosphatase YjhB (NUDIX family)